jgi:hypothetical protein
MSNRGDALRLAIYLDMAGLVPDCQKCRTWDDVVAALSVQFFSLPAEVRRDAKAHSGYVMSQGIRLGGQCGPHGWLERLQKSAFARI